MICLKCGKENLEQNKFCSGCGNNLIKNENLDSTKTISFDDLKDKVEEIKEESIINSNINENINSVEINQNIESNNDNVTNNNLIDREFYGDDFKEKKNNIGIIVLLIIFVLFVGLGVGYYFLSKPKNMLFFSVQKYFSKLENSSSKNINSISTTYNVSFDMKSSDDKINTLFNIYNNLKLSGTYEFDINKEIGNIEVGSTYKDKTLLNGSMYIEDNNYYLLLDGIYDNYIKYSNKNINNNQVSNEIDKKDIENIINGLKNAVKNSIKDNYLTKDKEKVTINDKEYNTNKITLTIDKNNFKTIMKDIFIYLKNDKNFVISVNNISKEDITNKIDEVLNNLDKLNNEDIPIEIKMNFYIKNFTNEIIKLEIKNNLSGIEVFNFIMIENNIDIMVKNNDDIIKVNYKINGNENVFEMINKDIDMKFVVNVDTKYNKTIINKDVSSSVYFDDISEQEITEITNKFNSQEGFIEFQNDLSSYIDSLFNTPLMEEKYYEDYYDNDNNIDDTHNNYYASTTNSDKKEYNIKELNLFKKNKYIDIIN